MILLRKASTLIKITVSPLPKPLMPRKVVKLHRLEDLFCETSTDKSMKLQVLQDITENFSVDTVIGSGGFAVVHKVSRATCLFFSL